MGRLCVSNEKSSRFAVYCGGGVYVRGVSLENNRSVVETGPLSGALCASRGVAVGALHTARRAGLNAWLVQHPAAAVGCSYEVA